MSLTDVHHEQEKCKCACVALSSRDCIRRRSPESFPWDEDYDDQDDERCSCSCHEGEYDEEDE